MPVFAAHEAAQRNGSVYHSAAQQGILVWRRIDIECGAGWRSFWRWSPLRSLIALSQLRRMRRCARVCVHNLTGLMMGRSPAVPVYRNDAAIRQQRQKIDKIRSDLYSLDCGGGSIIVFNNRTQSMCRRVAAALDREEAELERLLRQRNAAAAPAPRGSAARQRILAALRANGCPEDDGVRIRQSLDLEGDENLIDLDDPYSRYRTVCVRTCDGYYFPVSFSASPLQFVSDAQRCAPGGGCGPLFSQGPGPGKRGHGLGCRPDPLSRPADRLCLPHQRPV